MIGAAGNDRSSRGNAGQGRDAGARFTSDFDRPADGWEIRSVETDGFKKIIRPVIAGDVEESAFDRPVQLE